MLMIKHALTALIKSGDAAIINTSSGAALLGDLARTAYAASKSAVNALTLYVAAQYGKQGVRCNVISPGMVPTDTSRTNQPEMIEKEIGRASCRERVCQYVWISVAAVTLKKKKK